LSTDVDLYDHIKHMIWTTGTAFIVAAIVFFIVGLFTNSAGIEIPETVNEIMSVLSGSFHLNVLYLIPIVIILYGSMTRKPTIHVMLLASLNTLLNGVIFEGYSLTEGIDATLKGFDVSMIGELEESAVFSDTETLL